MRSNSVLLLFSLFLSTLLVSCARPRAAQRDATVSAPRSTAVAAQPAAAPARLTAAVTPIGRAPTSPPPLTPTATPPTASARAISGPPARASGGGLAHIRTKIEIVWPHGAVPAREATLANITAYLLAGPGDDPPPCDWDPVVQLWGAQDGGPARLIASGQRRMSNRGGNLFPVWDFNDIDVSAARQPTSKIAFFALVAGVDTAHNIWVHASDARTIFPQADLPPAAVLRRPAAVDARIEIVWPHNSARVEEASLANITAYLFEAGTKNALAPTIDWTPVVRLHSSLNSDTEDLDGTVVGVPRTIAGDAVRFLAWDFNDVDVSAARDPLNRVYFWVSVDDVPTSSNIWAHGVDARTLFPEPEILNSCR